jgi:hypothetical protein
MEKIKVQITDLYEDYKAKKMSATQFGRALATKLEIEVLSELNKNELLVIENIVFVGETNEFNDADISRYIICIDNWFKNNPDFELIL